ncbi:hypothetical protein BZL29_1647 [Mycobacterium kansasii]|uniref:Uncharacterized protein n=1 Tax=Mycobacterium kansasii TaxID=1768 RepID=A0A1V3XPK2_MYCKA|nr:hypothetical protein BZL29_1647 [Mycobacterium kansasii]
MAGNVTAAQERLVFADRNIGMARELSTQAVSGGNQAWWMPFAPLNPRSDRPFATRRGRQRRRDIRHAVTELPSVLADVTAGIKQADEQLQKTPAARRHTPATRRRADAPHKPSKSPATLAARRRRSARHFCPGEQGRADLDRVLTTVAQEQANAERLNRSFEQALFTAESRVRAVSDYIDTRRGSIGPKHGPAGRGETSAARRA